MIHSFQQVINANGNVTIVFFEDNKKRQIIFTKGTEALSDYMSIELKDIKEKIIQMKRVYNFKANKANRSIFRPVNPRHDCLYNELGGNKFIDSIA